MAVSSATNRSQRHRSKVVTPDRDINALADTGESAIGKELEHGWHPGVDGHGALLVDDCGVFGDGEAQEMTWPKRNLDLVQEPRATDGDALFEWRRDFRTHAIRKSDHTGQPTTTTFVLLVGPRRDEPWVEPVSTPPFVQDDEDGRLFATRHSVLQFVSLFDSRSFPPLRRPHTGVPEVDGERERASFFGDRRLRAEPREKRRRQVEENLFERSLGEADAGP